MYPNGIGKQLRLARESLGLTTEDVAAQTRIAVRYLDALEGNRYEELPGLVFARNFVRQYATALKLDPEPLLAALPKLDESHIQLPVPPSSARSARWDSREKSLAISAVWLLAIAGLAAVGWHFREARPMAVIQSLYPGAVQTAVRVVPALPAVQTDAVAASVHPTEPAPITAPMTAPAETAPLPSTQVALAAASPSEPVPVRVVVKATQASWVSLTADGKSSFAGVLKENEIRTISATEQVKLVTGNAGGVTVSLNGKELDPLGPLGQVRVLRLTAEGSEFLARTPRPASAPL